MLAGLDGYDRDVFAIIFHFWLGFVLVLAGGAVVVGLIGGYVKTVSAAKYPNGKRNRDEI